MKRAEFLKVYQDEPQLIESGIKTWIIRGQNFLVAISKVVEGTILVRDNNIDEYMVFLPYSNATIYAGSTSQVISSNSVTIVPPGQSKIVANDAGYIVRIFSDKATDLLAKSQNHASYQDKNPDIAPLTYWPQPTAGFQIRNYNLADYIKSETNFRIFRSTNMMINVTLPNETPRDIRALSPHSHDDFEQASLVVKGDYIHHMRYPWTKDMTTWIEDEHISIGSPSVLIIPAKAIHTSRNVSEQAWLIDIFSPPRIDFSQKAGLVCNEDEYPMLEQ